MTNGKKNVEKVQIVQIIEYIFLDIHVRSGRGNTVLLIYMQTYPTRLLWFFFLVDLINKWINASASTIFDDYLCCDDCD